MSVKKFKRKTVSCKIWFRNIKMIKYVKVKREGNIVGFTQNVLRIYEYSRIFLHEFCRIRDNSTYFSTEGHSQEMRLWGQGFLHLSPQSRNGQCYGDAVVVGFRGWDNHHTCCLSLLLKKLNRRVAIVVIPTNCRAVVKLITWLSSGRFCYRQEPAENCTHKKTNT